MMKRNGMGSCFDALPTTVVAVVLVVWGIVACGLAGTAHAQPADELHAKPRMLAIRQAAMPGETVMLAIDFAIDKGWHMYWPGYNDSGFALEAKMASSDNATVGSLIWPAPHRFSPAEGILDHVFMDHETVLLPVTINPNAQLGQTVLVRADLHWLVCEAFCLPESATVSIELSVSNAQSRPDVKTVEVFERAKARFPQPLDSNAGVDVSLEGNTLVVHAMGARQVAFYPLEDSREPRNLLEEGLTRADTLRVSFYEGDKPIVGVLEIWDELPPQHEGKSHHTGLSGMGGKSRVYAIELGDDKHDDAESSNKGPASGI